MRGAEFSRVNPAKPSFSSWAVFSVVFLLILGLGINLLIPNFKSYFFPHRAAAASWYDYDWGWRTPLTIDKDQISTSDQTDFPVLINSTHAAWKTVANGGYAGKSNGGDFLFTSSDGTTKLKHEIEEYDETTGELIAWVKVPTLSHTVDTVLYVYYGNATCADQWETDGSTWSSDFQGVWHLKEQNSGAAAGTDLYADSSANTNTGKDYASATGKDGQIGSGQQFDGSNDYLNVGNDSSINIGGDLTVSFWMKGDADVTVNRAPTAKEAASNCPYRMLLLQTSGKMEFQFTVGGAWQAKVRSTTSLNDNAWRFVTAVRDDTAKTYRIYVNGVSEDNDTYAGSVNTNTTNTYLGESAYGGGTLPYKGYLDEMRFADAARSVDWILTEYNNQSAPGTFYALGTDEQGDDTPPTNPTHTDGYSSVAKTTTLTSGNWYSYTAPHFEWSGAADPHSGVAGYYIYWGTDGAADPQTEGAFQVGETYTASNPTQGATYYLRVRTENNAHLVADPATLFIYKFDAVAPTIPEYINVTPQGCSTQTSFTFTWPASTDADSGVAGYYYKLGSTGTVTNAGNVLTKIASNYQEGDNVFYLRSIDNAGNSSDWQTSVYCSTASATVVDGPDVEAGPSSITVEWTSSKNTTGYVKVYEGNTYVSEQGHTTYSQTHSVKVVGLESERAYRYQIVWTDEDGNLGESEWFETNTATTPQVTNLKAEAISPTNMLISWQTNYLSSNTIEYGSGGYDNTETLEGSATNFSKQLQNLTAGTAYQLRVKAYTEDQSLFSGGLTFNTPPLPSISGLGFESIKDRVAPAVKVAWTTNVETTSSVFYRPSGSGSYQEQSSSDKKINHELTIEGLADSTTYEIYASGIDSFGNEAKSAVNTFTTPLDTRPPNLIDLTIETSNVGVGKEDEAQIIVSWRTDEPATGYVEYGEGISGESYRAKTTEDPVMTNSHIIIASGFSDQTPYHLRACSKDKGNNLACSTDQTVIPGEVPKSLLNIILDALKNAFGWLEVLIR